MAVLLLLFVFVFVLRSGFIIRVCSPHIRTIRERMTLGRSGEPVSAKALSSVFQENKESLDHAIEVENGCISHFEANPVYVMFKSS